MRGDRHIWSAPAPRQHEAGARRDRRGHRRYGPAEPWGFLLGDEWRLSPPRSDGRWHDGPWGVRKYPAEDRAPMRLSRPLRGGFVAPIEGDRDALRQNGAQTGARMRSRRRLGRASGAAKGRRGGAGNGRFGESRPAMLSRVSRAAEDAAHRSGYRARRRSFRVSGTTSLTTGSEIVSSTIFQPANLRRASITFGSEST